MKKTHAVGIGAAIAAAVLVMLCCGGTMEVGMLNKDKEAKPAAAPSAVATTRAPAPSPSASPSPSPSPVPVKMPNVTGQNAAIAQDTLQRAGFTNITLGSADPDDTLVILPENWKVVEQSTEAGQTVLSDTKIVLSCSKKR